MTKPDSSAAETAPSEAKRPFFLHTRPAAYAALIFALAIGVCYALAMYRDFDFTIGHFALDSVPFHIAAVVCGIGVLIAAVAYLFSGTMIYDPLPEPTSLSAFSGVLAAAMCLVILYQAILVRAAAIPTKFITPENLSLFSALAGLFLGASVLVNFFSAQSRGMKTLPVVCAVIGALSVNLAMFACYFDFTVPLNSPVRNLTTLMQAAILLFLFSEARLTLVKGPKELPVPFQIATQYAAVILGLGISLGGILWRLLRAVSAAFEPYSPLTAGPDPTLPLPRLVLYLALSLLAFDRLLAGIRTMRPLTKEEIEEAERKAKEEKEKKKRKKKGEEEASEE
ncbi:MAG: hypothetical protein IKX19_08185 [Clostridia bacterium]|nr:hypothetical protein [Clostridia bacterium]